MWANARFVPYSSQTGVMTLDRPLALRWTVLLRMKCAESTVGKTRKESAETARCRCISLDMLRRRLISKTHDNISNKLQASWLSSPDVSKKEGRRKATLAASKSNTRTSSLASCRPSIRNSTSAGGCVSGWSIL